MSRDRLPLWERIICVSAFIVLIYVTYDGLTDDSPSYSQLEVQRDAYRDSLAIANHEKQVLVMQLDTLQKIKIDEIRSVDSIHVDSLLLFISNFPTAKP